MEPGLVKYAGLCILNCVAYGWSIENYEKLAEHKGRTFHAEMQTRTEKVPTHLSEDDAIQFAFERQLELRPVSFRSSGYQRTRRSLLEIEMELRQFEHGWKCDYTLIKHPGRTQTIHYGDKEFPTMELAEEYALREAHDAIDRGQ